MEEIGDTKPPEVEKNNKVEVKKKDFKKVELSAREIFALKKISSCVASPSTYKKPDSLIELSNSAPFSIITNGTLCACNC